MSKRPACQNCDFFNTHRQQCSRHKFVMPQLEWHTLCADWQHESIALQPQALTGDYLYYYANDDGKITELAPFDVLQNPLMSVTVQHDAKRGWVIAPRINERFFPSPGLPITVHLDDQALTFEIAHAEQSQPAPAAMLLYCPQKPDVLQTWLLRHAEDAKRSFAFLEMIGNGEYSLYPDKIEPAAV